ncbi:unnamed protein product [Boreogadus saida]
MPTGRPDGRPGSREAGQANRANAGRWGPGSARLRDSQLAHPRCCGVRGGRIAEEVARNLGERAGHLITSDGPGACSRRQIEIQNNNNNNNPNNRVGKNMEELAGKVALYQKGMRKKKNENTFCLWVPMRERECEKQKCKNRVSRWPIITAATLWDSTLQYTQFEPAQEEELRARRERRVRC